MGGEGGEDSEGREWEGNRECDPLISITFNFVVASIVGIGNPLPYTVYDN